MLVLNVSKKEPVVYVSRNDATFIGIELLGLEKSSLRLGFIGDRSIKISRERLIVRDTLQNPTFCRKALISSIVDTGNIDLNLLRILLLGHLKTSISNTQCDFTTSINNFFNMYVNDVLKHTIYGELYFPDILDSGDNSELKNFQNFKSFLHRLKDSWETLRL